eukprot:6459849-Amphidinium_carterae.1
MSLVAVIGESGSTQLAMTRIVQGWQVASMRLTAWCAVKRVLCRAADIGHATHSGLQTVDHTGPWVTRSQRQKLEKLSHNAMSSATAAMKCNSSYVCVRCHSACLVVRGFGHHT